MKVFIRVLNPFEDSKRENITPKESKPPLFVSTKSSIVFSAILYMFGGIISSRKKRILVESISGISELM